MSAIITYPTTDTRWPDTSKITWDKILQQSGGGGGGGGTTFHILAETGDVLATEGSNQLRTE